MQLRVLPRVCEPDTIGDRQSPPPESVGPVEQYAWLATFVTERPRLAGALQAVAERLAAAQDLGWTGKIQINIQTGEVMGGPAIK